MDSAGRTAKGSGLLQAGDLFMAWTLFLAHAFVIVCSRCVAGRSRDREYTRQGSAGRMDIGGGIVLPNTEERR